MSEYPITAAIFTGNQIDNLTEVIRYNDFWSPVPRFPVEQGVPIQLRVSGSGGLEGVSFEFGFVSRRSLADDAFEGRQKVYGESILLTFPRAFSTLQPGEPYTNLVGSAGSRWLEWLPPRTGRVRVRVQGGSLGVFTGSDLSRLIPWWREGLSLPDDAFAEVNAGEPVILAVYALGPASTSPSLELQYVAPPELDRRERAIPVTAGRINISHFGSRIEDRPERAWTHGNLWFAWIAPATELVSLKLANGFGSPHYVIHSGDPSQEIEWTSATAPHRVVAGRRYEFEVHGDARSDLVYEFELQFQPSAFRVRPPADPTGPIQLLADSVDPWSADFTEPQIVLVETSDDLVRWRTWRLVLQDSPSTILYPAELEESNVAFYRFRAWR